MFHIVTVWIQLWIMFHNDIKDSYSYIAWKLLFMLWVICICKVKYENWLTLNIYEKQLMVYASTQYIQNDFLP